jgi:outer membrane protein assembly factor BamB
MIKNILMKKIIVLFWVFVQILPIAGCSPVMLLSASQRLEREGDELVSADRGSEAILAYHQAIIADPNNRSALVKLAPLYYGQGRTRKAGEIINQLADNEKTRIEPDMQVVDPENLDRIKLRWMKTPVVDTPNGIAADTEMVAAAYHNGLVFGLQLQNGTVLWSKNLAESLTSPPTISLKSVLVGCESGKVIALDRNNGETLWVVQLSGAVYAGLFVDNEIGYVGSYGGMMTAINLTDGRILWQIDAGSPILASAMKEAGIIYFGTAGGSVYSVDALTGIQLWGKPVQLPGSIESKPVLAGNRLLIGDNNSRLYALDLNGRDYYWAHSTPDSVYASPLVDGNRVYIFSSGQTAAAVDLSTGSLIWEQDLPVVVRNTPMINNAMIYFAGATQPFLFELDAATGKIIGQANTGDWIEYGPIEASGYLLLADKDGAILVYQIIQN